MGIMRGEIAGYVEQHIPSFHASRLESLKRLKLKSILRRKNPYLFRAKNMVTASELIEGLLDAHLSSQEEGIFGHFLEALAIYVNELVYGGKKSAAEGIDLEFERDGVRYIVSIKSGPNWGNSQQLARMRENFRKAVTIVRGPSAAVNVVAVNGCCYGKSSNENLGDYFKKCGQSFWTLISGDENFYVEIIEPLGHLARERNEEFCTRRAMVVNSFVREFTQEFCSTDGAILWDKLVKFNSEAKPNQIWTGPVETP